MTEQPAVAWGRVAWFVVLAFGLAWTAEFWGIAQGMKFDSLDIKATLLLGGVMFTPALAGLIMRLAGREGFATAGLRFGPWRYYLAVWLGAPLLIVAIYGATLALGLGRLDPTLSGLMARIQAMGGVAPPAHLLGPAILAQTLTIGLLITSVATFGEEFGWTGYLLVKLLPLGRWKAALIYGFIWGAWHAPVIAFGFNYPGYPVLGPLMMCGLAMAFALTQTALRLRARSVLLTSFAHASLNSQGLGLAPVLVVGVSPVLGGVTGLVGIAAFGIVGAILLATTPAAAQTNRVI
ncbi:hypothetical protein QO010_004412 [Caulobacter ginsengisoli]|uniref:CAAX prenyl protease 2/Lysostaphin resistance protein A-like domain-containing protein n=1 Tax=Caulobacter ginsengisoli TaxID=400775 RepID=A0ABU0IX73_9CAUL|nr:CPBP family glutamic-type intramembrane protease [Caulobacter ginsengisoli]MDQ0466616.1 hypothetical protein [Caulobacter ginsengisoli]